MEVHHGGASCFMEDTCPMRSRGLFSAGVTSPQSGGSSSELAFTRQSRATDEQVKAQAEKIAEFLGIELEIAGY